MTSVTIDLLARSACDAPFAVVATQIVQVSGAAVEVVELEEQVWRGLDEIAALEGITLDELCTLVHLTYLRGMSLDTGLRVYAVNYYRELERA